MNDEKKDLWDKANVVYNYVFRDRKMTFEEALKRYDITEEQFYKYMRHEAIFRYPGQLFSHKYYERYQACMDRRAMCYLYAQMEREKRESCEE
jgi:hypothetical protein